ncbi:hypothetical protein BOTBODRAFT_180233 [Botryobasidium botryosum FD-172 SS1]|uniref:Uncharacterized protein n=1 Tax=Botryobasidium botryosum (strain FD-172 SS1) TaxID=930990 RepID=A0A067M7Z5_BOTB1|nr:hypothetical protein BOTBODRAFT_180233 [Botryobasidium botryosum FD-172 SS1]
MPRAYARPYCILPTTRPNSANTLHSKALCAAEPFFSPKNPRVSVVASTGDFTRDEAAVAAVTAATGGSNVRKGLDGLGIHITSFFEALVIVGSEATDEVSMASATAPRVLKTVCTALTHPWKPSVDPRRRLLLRAPGTHLYLYPRELHQKTGTHL